MTGIPPPWRSPAAVAAAGADLRSSVMLTRYRGFCRRTSSRNLTRPNRSNFNRADSFNREALMAYLNVQRTALRLGVAPHTVRRWTASGLLPCMRTAGGHRRIREEDVDALAQQIGGSTHLEARRAREREVETLLETSLALVGQLELPDLLRRSPSGSRGSWTCDFCAISTYDAASQSHAPRSADFDATGRRLPDVGDVPRSSRFPLTRRVLRGPGAGGASTPATRPPTRTSCASWSRGRQEPADGAARVPAASSIGLVELMDHAARAPLLAAGAAHLHGRWPARPRWRCTTRSCSGRRAPPRARSAGCAGSSTRSATRSPGLATRATRAHCWTPPRAPPASCSARRAAS